MILKVSKSSPAGSVKIPGSKSHTIRALYIASLADGVSEISDPLDSGDTQSAIAVCKALGAAIEQSENTIVVRGFAGNPRASAGTIDVGNSGTSIRLGVAVAALGSGKSAFTGDAQIQSRPMGPLLHALHNLGAEVRSEKQNNMAPLWVQGPLKGGETELRAVTSQYLSALLIACPLCEGNTEIVVSRLNEKPYVEITLWWLDKQEIEYENIDDMARFRIPGNQAYRAFKQSIPADFSSATFFLVQAALSGKEMVMENLDLTDPQGDKRVIDYLERMGAKVRKGPKGLAIKGGKLVGREIDMNATPDALPAMAVAGCFAEGETVLHNVPQARAKETDRIRVMCLELAKMGADIKELSDGLIVRKSDLRAADLQGHSDHRVVMALSLAGMNTEGETTINTAESVGITFPNYVELMQQCGANIEKIT